MRNSNSTLIESSNKKKSQISIKNVIFQYTGAPLTGGKKMQLNFHMKPIEGVNFTRNLRNALVPVLWLYEVRDDGETDA